MRESFWVLLLDLDNGVVVVVREKIFLSKNGTNLREIDIRH